MGDEGEEKEPPKAGEFFGDLASLVGFRGMVKALGELFS
jgi:hypothetical protein